MEFKVEEYISKINGTLLRYTTELNYKREKNDKQIQLSGNIVITRIYERSSNSKTEVRDDFPIDVTVPIKRLTDPDTQTSLSINMTSLENQDKHTLFVAEIILSNVETKDEIFNA
jgi:hypothetical protein